MSVRVVDHGYQEYLQECFDTDIVEVTVGVHSEEGSQSTKGGKTVAEIATINEFGLGVPARPAITGWADSKTDAVEILRDAIAKGLKARRKIGASLDRVAQAWAGEIQARISAGIPPKNAESTVKKKGSSKPLIDTGQYRSSIRGRVRGDAQAFDFSMPGGGGAGGSKKGKRKKGAKAKLKALGKRLTKAGARLAKRGKRIGKKAIKSGRRLTKRAIKSGRRSVRNLQKRSTRRRAK